MEWLVNLTPPAAHYDIIKTALNSGKPVYTEKPLTMDLVQARELVDLAKEKKVPLISAPITYLGDAQQLCLERIESGILGKIQFVTAELHNGFIEHWHPEPEPFLQVGPLYDIGLYPLMHMIHSLGRISQVQAMGSYVCPSRKSLSGVEFRIGEPDFITAHLRFQSGVVARLSLSFVLSMERTKSQCLEYHGSLGNHCVGKPLFFQF